MEAIEDAYVRLSQNHAQFQGDAEAFKAWATVTTQQAAMNILRARARERALFVKDGEEHEPAVGPPAEEAPLSQDPEALAFLRQHIGLLKDSQRRVIELLLEEKTYAEIAEILTVEEAIEGHAVVVTEEAVRKRKKYIVQHLKRVFRSRYPEHVAPAPLELSTVLDWTYENLVHNEVWEELKRLRWKVRELTDALGVETWRVADLERQWKSDVARLERERDEALARAWPSTTGAREP